MRTVVDPLVLDMGLGLAKKRNSTKITKRTLLKAYRYGKTSTLHAVESMIDNFCKKIAKDLESFAINGERVYGSV